MFAIKFNPPLKFEEEFLLFIHDPPIRRIRDERDKKAMHSKQNRSCLPAQKDPFFLL